MNKKYNKLYNNKVNIINNNNKKGANFYYKFDQV